MFRQSKWSAKAARRAFLSWSWRQIYLPSSLSAPKLQKKKSSPFTWKFTSNKGCQDPHPGNQRADGGGSVLLQRLPRAEGRGDIQCHHEASIQWCPALKEQSSWEEGNLNRTEPGYCEGAHKKALAVAAAHKGEIERLSHPLSQRWPEVRVRLKSKDHQMHGSMEHKRRQCQVRFSNIHTTHQLARESPESGKGELTPADSSLGEPPELEPGVTSFLTGLAESSEEEGPPLEPPVGELHEWVTWKAEMTKTPDWWRELLVLLGVPNFKKLAQQVWASFSHPRRAKEMKYHCHAPSPTMSP